MQYCCFYLKRISADFTHQSLLAGLEEHYCEDVSSPDLCSSSALFEASGYINLYEHNKPESLT